MLALLRNALASAPDGAGERYQVVSLHCLGTAHGKLIGLQPAATATAISLCEDRVHCRCS